MVIRRILYAIALLGGVFFYWAYREWLSWFILLLLLTIPLFSLLVSLPAIRSCRGSVKCPGSVPRNTDTEVCWQGRGRLPLPVVDGKLLVRHCITGQTMKVASGDLLPTGHCGRLEITLHKPRCYDYLGLIGLPVRKHTGAAVLVRPEPVPVKNPPDLSRYQVSAWKPKPGGGFSENHELRLYRPGDNLRQVHWKLSAKTGKLIIREPMEAVQNRMLLTLELRGSGEELDEKLGQLLWMSDYLLGQELPHLIHVLTGDGMQLYAVSREGQIQEAMDQLLGCSAAPEEAQAAYISANWRYHIGGDGSGS